MKPPKHPFSSISLALSGLHPAEAPCSALRGFGWAWGWLCAASTGDGRARRAGKASYLGKKSPGWHGAHPCLRLLLNLPLREGRALLGDFVQDTHLHLSRDGDTSWGQFVAPLWSKQVLAELCCVTEGAGAWEVQPSKLVNILKG